MWLRQKRNAAVTHKDTYWKYVVKYFKKFANKSKRKYIRSSHPFRIHSRYTVTPFNSMKLRLWVAQLVICSQCEENIIEKRNIDRTVLFWISCIGPNTYLIPTSITSNSLWYLHKLVSNWYFLNHKRYLHFITTMEMILNAFAYR